ncbi:flagellar basal body rod protein FlgB [Hydrogenovibrio kuenenii]|uniref:flagellar basal body rod protein FlgB n=1 Tax=Hydrogenovibrio kuenenii TaxID=63658 RepID=UPI0004676C55|nr:flagellar basal body rod protein FlgB [Hydrogenovibrio kuenenii]
MDSIFGIHEQALLIRKERESVLANNLANADTPNFKARDLDWRKEIKHAQDQMDAKKFKPDLEMTNSRHIEAFADLSTDDYLKYRVPSQPSLDGNTVEAHVEKAKFMENAIQYQASLEFINGRISGIRAALTGN